LATRTALVVGASGLIGSACVSRLLDDPLYDAVVVLGRRAPRQPHPKLRSHIIDFDQPAQWAALAVADDVFCCLGTTIKKAGTQDAFRKVDYTYSMAVATAARANGARNFLLVSALGAHPRALAFYSRVKGELELAVSNLGYPAVNIFRPSLLVGEREEARAAEHVGLIVGKMLSVILVGPLRRYRPIRGDVVAACMIATAKRERPGRHVFESEQIAAC
jgi:uncharacterized protein YbjT (DUF2867 family)